MTSRVFRIPALAAVMLSLVLCASFAFAAPSTNPARRVSVDQGKAEAATLLAKGKAEEAYTLYMRLVREAPGDDAVNLGLARSAAKAGRLNQAVMAYETVLEKHPREAVLYNELADVYTRLKDTTASERSRAMARSLAAKDAGAEAAEMGNLERGERFYAHGKVRTGVLYDTNANVGPRNNTIDLGTWKVNLQDGKARDTFGGYLGADVDLGWRFSEDSPWWLVGDAQMFVRGNANNKLHDIHSQESQWGRAAVGVRHLSSTTLTEVRLKAEVFDYEFYQNVSSFGPEATFLWAVDPKVHLITRAGVDQRVYSQDNDRNGVYGWAGEYLRLLFGSDNHEFVIGMRYLGAFADKTAYGYDGWEGSARFLFKLPYGFEVGPFVSFGQDYYKGPGTVLESKQRRDDRLRMGSSLTYRITEAWSAEMSYQYTNNDSRSDFYKYEQHLVSTGISWNF